MSTAALELRTAVERVLAGASPVSVERLPLADAAGRVLAADVRARAALPAWDNSAMDGYAVRAVDVVGASRAVPVRLAGMRLRDGVVSQQ